MVEKFRSAASNAPVESNLGQYRGCRFLAEHSTHSSGGRNGSLPRDRPSQFDRLAPGAVLHFGPVGRIRCNALTFQDIQDFGRHSLTRPIIIGQR